MGRHYRNVGPIVGDPRFAPLLHARTILTRLITDSIDKEIMIRRTRYDTSLFHSRDGHINDGASGSPASGMIDMGLPARNETFNLLQYMHAMSATCSAA